MKKMLLIIICLIPILQACEDYLESGIPQGEVITWDIMGSFDDGSESFFVSQEIESHQSTVMHLELTTNSLCPNTGMKVYVQVGTVRTFEVEVFEFPYHVSIPIPQERNVLLRSGGIQNHNTDIVCAWGGVVEAKLTY